MCASFASFFRSGPPPPKVALLPDALFFSRSIAITAGASATEAAAQVELALEAISPFPLPQLYYGSYWKPGAERAFVFAAYRRRFTAEQTAAWADAEYVIPASAAFFGAAVQPATTVILAAPESLTAIYWDHPSVPAEVLVRSLDPAATDEDRLKVRDELIRDMGGSKIVIDLMAPPAAEPAYSDREVVFRSGDLVSKLSASVATALDVRDKAQLHAFQGARKRDIILWRVALGCVAAALLLGLGQIALVGGNAWQKVRLAQLNVRKPTVEKIKTSQLLANRIEDLTTNGLLPFEMMSAMVGAENDRLPPDIQFTQIRAAGVLKLIVTVTTSNPAQISAYTTKLKALPEFEDVVPSLVSGGGALSTYQLEVSFKPKMLKPQPPHAPS